LFQTNSEDTQFAVDAIRNDMVQKNRNNILSPFI